jgi:hypothetical protein
VEKTLKHRRKWNEPHKKGYMMLDSTSTRSSSQKEYRLPGAGKGDKNGEVLFNGTGLKCDEMDSDDGCAM